MAGGKAYPPLGVSDATLKRGYSTIRPSDVPPKTLSFGSGDSKITMPNPERMVYDDDCGEMTDAYCGGFLRRGCPEEEDC